MNEIIGREALDSLHRRDRLARIGIDVEALERARRPVETANGLPNPFYTDPAVWEVEKQAAFFDTWAGLAFAKDVAAPGDAMPVDFLGQPLLVVRDREGAVRVYQNICRHRGMILVSEKTNIKGAIRCPYHAWSYALDGCLRTTPHVGGPGRNIHETICREKLGLIEVRSHVWRDVIFVNLSGTAPAFEEHAAPLIARWAEFEQPVYHSGPDSSFKLEVATNWKLAVENYCESYHLPWVHPGLNSYSRLEDHYHIEQPGAFSGQGTLVYRPMISEDGSRFADFDGLSEKWAAGAEYVSLFPNVLLGVHRDHAFAIILEPVAQDRTIEHIELYYATPGMCGDERAGMRATNTALWKTVFAEDVFVVEGMQKGRKAQGFDGGRFSPVMDSPTHLLHAWVADRFLGA